jgi:hypothetical protein
MADYQPSSLPPVDSVVVVDIRRVDAKSVGSYMVECGDAPSFALSESDSQRAAELWRQLPLDEMYRCHTPSFGLRFVRGGEVIVQASVCFKCNNIFGDQRGENICYVFDSQSPVAQELLQLCREATGIEQPT